MFKKHVEVYKNAQNVLVGIRSDESGAARRSHCRGRLLESAVIPLN